MVVLKIQKNNKSLFAHVCPKSNTVDWILLCSYYLANSLVCRLVPFLMDIGGQLKSSRLFGYNDWSLWPIFWHCPACREPVMGLAPECQVDYLGFCYYLRLCSLLVCREEVRKNNKK